MKNILKKVVSIVVIFGLVLQFFAPITFAYYNEENTIRSSNAFIEYLVDNRDGRFIIRTLEGVPYKTSDNNKKLIFERDNDPETSFTTFRVDGTDYIYGNAYANKSGKANDYVISYNGLVTQSHWELDGLNIIQSLEIIEDPEHPNLGNVKIKYDVTNNSSTSKNVGNRILLDTQTGYNDAASFNASTQNITTETMLNGSEIPDFYRTSDNDIAPSVIGYGFIKGFGNIEPDRVAFAHYNTLSASKWDINIDQTLDFTTADNRYGGADSAVAYYFNEKPLAVGETRTYVTYYGLGDFSHFNTNSPYQVVVNTPSKLTVNDNKTGYVENEITVSVTIDNTLETSQNLTNVQISLIKRDFIFANVDDEEYSFTEPAITKGEVKTYEFKVKPLKQNKYISEPIKAIVTSDNNPNGVSNYDYTLLPNSNGAKPNLTLETISPKTIYYKGYREFSFTGSGFDMLNNSSAWKLFLVNTSGNEVEIPDSCITIDSDEKMTVILYEDSIVTPTGKYGFKLTTTDYGSITTPTSKMITFSDNVKYKSRKYGVLYIEKDNNNKYLIKNTDSLETLKTIKQNKTVILDIVGDVIEKTDSNNNPYYIVKTDNQKALINSVIEYKDTDKPIKIQKKNDLITIEGDGTLQIVGNNEFWWWNFYTYISDGVDYVTDSIVDEGEDGINLVIDFYNPINTIGAIANSVYDGFNLEIKNVILLDEGASFGGKLEVEIPYGQEVPVEEEELSDEELDDILEESLVDLFLSDEARAEKYAKKEKHDARMAASIKIRGLLFNDDAIYSKIEELINSSSKTPVQKANIISGLVLSSPELVSTIYSCIKGKPDDDGDRKSVGVTIDVKKVLFGKKYNDFLYDSVKYIGIDAEGEVKVTLPFGTEKDREEDELQGVKAVASINTIDGEYSFEADVNLELCEASAIVSIVKVKNQLKPDHIELSAGYNPGVPLVAPIFINKVGGGVKNLTGRDPAEPMNIIMILGLNLEPAMEGEFRAEVSKEGFALEGSFEFENGLEILKDVGVELHWVKPVYFKANATVELFDIIEGTASLFIGEKEQEDNTYKFFFEGKASVSLSIPEDVWLVGGANVGTATLGVSTEKMWGSISIIKFEVGVTYTYGKDVSFNARLADNANIDYTSLTNLLADESGIYQHDFQKEQGTSTKGSLIVGSNIRKIGDSNRSYASNNIGDIAIVSNQDHTSYDITLNNVDNALLEIEYTGLTPIVNLNDPNTGNYELELNENYLLKEVTIESSSIQKTIKYMYISINNPDNGTWVLTSNNPLESVTVYEGKSMPKLTALDFTQTEQNLDVTFNAVNSDGALVTLFLVNTNDENSAGFGLLSNISANSGTASVEIPSNLPEGEYKIRATIQHPSYGFDEILSTNTITIADTNKPQDVTGLVVNNIGDSLLRATFNELTEEGDIEYFITVYDENLNVINGYNNLKTTTNNIVFGGSYTSVDQNGNTINYQMPSGRNYKISITPVKTLTVDSQETVHVGNETYSSLFTKRIPNPPTTIVSYLEHYISENGINYFGSNQIQVMFDSNQTIDIDVYVDKEYYLSFKDRQNIELPLQLIDGEHIIDFYCKNNYNDTTHKTVSFITDTTKPELFIDTPGITEVVQSSDVDIAGIAETGSRVYIDETEVTLDSDGRFTHTLDISGKIKHQLTIKAVDNVGNETIYKSEIVNSSINPLESIVIEGLGDKLYTGTKTKLTVKAKDKVSELLLDNTDIEFTLLKGDSLASINAYGELEIYDIGDITILATYYLTDDYSLQDAIDIEVETGFADMRIVPEIMELRIGNSIALSALGTTKYNEIQLNENKITYSLVKGASYASLNNNVLTATKPGYITVKAVYSDTYKTAEALLDIRILPEKVIDNQKNANEDTDSNSADIFEAKEITNINNILTGVWQNLLERERNLEIISAREILAKHKTAITLTNIGKLEIPQDTINSNDVFLSGVVTDPDHYLDSNYKLVGDIYELTFKDAGGKLENPIKLTLLLSESSQDNTGIYVYNEIFNKWQYLGGDINGNSISTNLEHLSKYAVLTNMNSHEFRDIAGNWAEKIIKSLDSIGVISGEYSGGYRYFAPKRNLSRLELAALVVRIYEKTHTLSVTETNMAEIFADYQDIPDWGKECAKKAYTYGLIMGDNINGETYFNPKALATRAQTVTVISRAIGLEKINSYEFIDSKDIPIWAKPHFDHLISLGFLGGYSDGSIRPNNKITRAEIAKIFYYWVDYEVMKFKE